MSSSASANLTLPGPELGRFYLGYTAVGVTQLSLWIVGLLMVFLGWLLLFIFSLLGFIILVTLDICGR